MSKLTKLVTNIFVDMGENKSSREFYDIGSEVYTYWYEGIPIKGEIIHIAIDQEKIVYRLQFEYDGDTKYIDRNDDMVFGDYRSIIQDFTDKVLAVHGNH